MSQAARPMPPRALSMPLRAAVARGQQGMGRTAPAAAAYSTEAQT